MQVGPDLRSQHMLPVVNFFFIVQSILRIGINGEYPLESQVDTCLLGSIQLK